MRRGQALTDYIILVGLVTAAFIALFIYISRSNQGNIRSQAEQLEARQYDPYDTTLSNSEQKHSTIQQESASSTTTTHGNMQDKKNKEKEALDAAQDAIEGNYKTMYGFYQTFENQVTSSASEEAGKVLSGTYPWDFAKSTSYTDLKNIGDTGAKFEALGKTAEAAAEAFKKSRTPDKSSSGQRGVSDSYTATTRNINERLGPLR